MKPFRVVCIKKGSWSTLYTYEPIERPSPKHGEIYTVIRLKDNQNNNLYVLAEFGEPFGWLSKNFREIELSFGEWVEETIMKEAELETVLI